MKNHFINPRQSWIAAAAVLGALGIILGAFGAHMLKKILSLEQLDTFETGVRYQCYHALALFAMGSSGMFTTNKWYRWAARCWIAGVILFSGSLYLMVFLKTLHLQHFISIVGPITPIGGALLIGGWLLVVIGSLRRAV